MKPHKHAELIKAWADGAEIECKGLVTEGWYLDTCPTWNEVRQYRIKPEPKPDSVGYLLNWGNSKAQWCEFRVEQNNEDGEPIRPQLKLTFDGETGELKSAEVLR